MPRLTRSRSSKRRSVSKAQGSKTSPTEFQEATLVRRSKSRSRSLSRDKSSSSETESYRQVRSRTSTQNKRASDRKLPTKQLQDSTDSEGRGRKRGASQSSSKSHRASKRREIFRPSLNVPLTRSRRASLQQVTPSPNSSKNSTFNFSSPVSKRGKTSSLPKGVIDLYPDRIENPTCMCGVKDCSADAVTASYILSYGKEYFESLKKNEQPTIVPTSPVSVSSSKSSIGKSTRATDSPSSVLTSETPEHRRDWVHVNTTAVEPSLPSESAAYLPYQPDLTPKMRSILVDWIIELSEHFTFSANTLHLAITLVDKVLACGPIGLHDDSDDDGDFESVEDVESRTDCFLISRERFQLLGACCTWMACKLEEMTPPNVDDFAYVSDNIYTTTQIKRMERRICKALDFCFCHQTPFPYAYEFMRASLECPNPSCQLHSSPIFHDVVMYMLEIGRIPYDPVTKKPSLIAAASVYLARVILGIRSNDTTLDPHGRWTRTLQYYTGYTKAELRETVLAIHKYHLAAEESSLKSVFSKYKSKKYHRVALKTVPSVEDLGF